MAERRSNIPNEDRAVLEEYLRNSTPKTYPLPTTPAPPPPDRPDAVPLDPRQWMQGSPLGKMLRGQ